MALAHWYLIHTKPGCETIAVANLERQGYRVHFPRLLKRALSGRRIVESVGPLFPRYLFLHLEAGRESMGPVRSTLGVSSIVRFGYDYAIVPDLVVAALKAKADAQTGLHHLEQARPLQPGSSLRIVAGVFDGLEGVFQRECAAERVVVLLDLLGQRTSVQVPAQFVQPQSHASSFSRRWRPMSERVRDAIG